MDRKKRHFIRGTVSALIAGSGLLVMMTGANFYLVFTIQNSVDKAAISRSLRRSTIDLLNTVQTAESGQRGFLLTQDEQFLEPFRKSLADLPKRLETFEKAAAASPAEARPEDVSDIEDLISKKVAEMKGTIELVSEHDDARALAIIRNASGLEMMKQLQTRLETIVETADKQTRQNLEQQNSMAGFLKFVTATGFISMVVLIAAAAHVISRFVGELQSAWRNLEIANRSLEEKVRERTRDLMAANEEIRRFAYIVTHDLRAPLVNIMGFTSELAKDAEILKQNADVLSNDDETEFRMRRILEEDLPESLGFIRVSTAKMDGLINAILRISREGQRTLRPEQLDIGLLAQRACDVVHHQVLAANGEIEIEAAKFTVTGDRMSLEQILGNLLDNAVKYREPERPLKITISARPVSDHYFELRVRDNGRGIDPRYHERIFDLFRRAGKQSEPGEGIGLAHLRSLVRNLGGEVHVESTLGQGAMFVVRLPRSVTDISKGSMV